MYRGIRVVDTLGGLGLEVRMGKPRLLYLFRRAFARLVSFSEGLLACIQPRSPPHALSGVRPPYASPLLLQRLWGAGLVENVHIDPTAVKGERLQWCGARRIRKERLLAKSCHRPALPSVCGDAPPAKTSRGSGTWAQFLQGS